MDAFAAIPTGHPMVALLELDVTTALAAITDFRARGARVSLFAFVVRSIGVAIAEHPDLNLVRHGKRLVRFEDVDVNVPVEVRTSEGARGTMRTFRWLPSFMRVAIMRYIMRSAFRVKAYAGTTLVTSVGKFASIPGSSFTFSTGPRAATFVVGSVVDKPWAHEGQIVLRKVLSISIMVDHDLVDGAPAARFAQRLQQLIESADGLS
jgi:pyruvate/2-oxoglutarate dehydrogenase complex dihydrolipoamide acyltransferase (E2) component